jgi:hypothetical protein
VKAPTAALRAGARREHRFQGADNHRRRRAIR